jgi:hypothetical protein
VSGGDEVEIMKPDDIAPSIFPKKSVLLLPALAALLRWQLLFRRCVFFGVWRAI